MVSCPDSHFKVREGDRALNVREEGNYRTATLYQRCCVYLSWKKHCDDPNGLSLPLKEFADRMRMPYDFVKQCVIRFRKMYPEGMTKDDLQSMAELACALHPEAAIRNQRCVVCTARRHYEFLYPSKEPTPIPGMLTQRPDHYSPLTSSAPVLKHQDAFYGSLYWRPPYPYLLPGGDSIVYSVAPLESEED